jgi:hypothetical protein
LSESSYTLNSTLRLQIPKKENKLQLDPMKRNLSGSIPERERGCGGLGTVVGEIRLQRIYKTGRVKLRRDGGARIERVVKPDTRRPGIYRQF